MVNNIIHKRRLQARSYHLKRLSRITNNQIEECGHPVVRECNANSYYRRVIMLTTYGVFSMDGFLYLLTKHLILNLPMPLAKFINESGFI